VPITSRMRRLSQLRERLRALTITPGTEGAFDDARKRLAERPPRHEQRVDNAMALVFLTAASALAAVAPATQVAAGTATALVVALAVLSRVEIDLALGFAVPTELAVVPMLFLLPPAYVPLLVAAGLMLGRAVDVVVARRHPERLVRGLCDAWFVLAPAAVFVAGSVDGVHAADWPWWLLAFAAQIGVDALVSSVGEWLRAGRWPRLHMRELGVVAFVDGALAPIGLLVAAVAADAPLALVAVVPLGALIAALAQERKARLEQAVELSSAYQGVALLLGEVIEDDDHYTGEHSRGVVALSVEIAQELGMTERDQRLVEFGALLHDVGKLRVPNEIINKPGPLDDDEWAIMRRHTIDGEAMLAPVGGMMHEVGRIVRGSHEDWDGTGYPDGLAGEQIPLASRIVSCADAYSAMTTDRSYRKALGHDKAIAELRRCAGTQFDPRVVEAAIAVVGRTPAPAPEALVLARAAVAAAA
jgi:putative nucleotidyltransferase with HDIG domain